MDAPLASSQRAWRQLPRTRDVGALLHHLADLVDLEEGGIGHSQLATNDRDAIEAFAARLIGQFQEVEPFRGQFESGVDTPKSVRPSRLAASLRHRTAVENADQPAPRGLRTSPRNNPGNKS